MTTLNESFRQLDTSIPEQISPIPDQNEFRTPRNNESFAIPRFTSPHFGTTPYSNLFNDFVTRNQSDPVLKELEDLEKLNIANVTEIIKKGGDINNEFITGFIRFTQTVAKIAEWAIFILGISVALISFVSLLTDPSPSLVLLSVIKGVGLGVLVSKLGTLLPNYTGRALEWLEVKWTNIRLVYSLNDEQRKTLDILKKWYKIKNEIENDRTKIKHNINYLKKFDYRCDGYDTVYHRMHSLEGKILDFKDATDRIMKSVNRDTGGKQVLDYLEDPSLYHFLFVKA